VYPGNVCPHTQTASSSMSCRAIFPPDVAILFKLPEPRYRRRPVVPSPGVFCHSCYKGTPISFYILVHHVRTRIGSGIYNNGRTSFIGAATATRRPSRIRANKATVDPRLPPEFSRDEITFRQLLGCASKIFPQACAYPCAECESSGGAESPQTA